MCECKKALLKFLKKDWTPSEKILIGISLILSGVVAGFVIAPIKRGIKVNWSLASHNGSRNGCNSGNDNKGNKGKLFGKKEKHIKEDKKKAK